MCLVVNVNATGLARAINPPEEFVVRYKIFRVGDEVESPYYPHVWKIGVNKADRVFVEDKNVTFGFGLKARMVHNAIHVYVEKSVAWSAFNSNLSINTDDRFMLGKVYCKNKNLVGLSHLASEEAYSEVTLKEEDYKAIQKGLFVEGVCSVLEK